MSANSPIAACDECDECGLAVDLDGNGLTISDYAEERHYCSHLCAIHHLSSLIWNALLDASARKEPVPR